MAAAGDATSFPEIPTRCHHCAGPLSKDMETSSWTVPPLVRDSFSMIGSAVGGIAGAFYSFNHGTTSYCVLLCLCRISRWYNTSRCTTGFIILSCCHVIALLCPLYFACNHAITLLCWICIS